MGGAGVCFTGCIGVGRSIPDVFYFVDGRLFADGDETVTLGAPVGILAGNPMLACVAGGPYPTSTVYTLTPDPAWTPLYEDTDNTLEVFTNLYYKVADASDAAGTSSYSWRLQTPGVLAGINVVHAGWREKFGATASGASVDHSATPSISSPGGRWQFGYIYQRSSSAFLQPTPDPVITSTEAELIHTSMGSGPEVHRAGTMRLYAIDHASPIVGAYQTGGISGSRTGMVVAAMSS